jgi:peptide-methionine (S)-S-oxide reductase
MIQFSETLSKPPKTMKSNEKIEIATLGGGCFWCSEAVFEALKGVNSVESGYSGGFVKNPSYREVCTGSTGHAEVVQVRFDPAVISYKEILEIFFHTHNPTTLNQQGADIGTQYRSVIFYHNPEQKAIAEQVIQELTESMAFDKPIATQISSFTAFYLAEEYHQDYFAKNPEASYCSYVIRPKIEKFEKKYSDKLK